MRHVLVKGVAAVILVPSGMVISSTNWAQLQGMGVAVAVGGTAVGGIYGVAVGKGWGVFVGFGPGVAVMMMTWPD